MSFPHEFLACLQTCYNKLHCAWKLFHLSSSKIIKIKTKLTYALVNPRLISEPFIAIIVFLTDENVQAFKRPDGVQTRLIVDVASRFTSVTFIDVFAFFCLGVLCVTISTTVNRNGTLWSWRYYTDFQLMENHFRLSRVWHERKFFCVCWIWNDINVPSVLMI